MLLTQIHFDPHAIANPKETQPASVPAEEDRLKSNGTFRTELVVALVALGLFVAIFSLGVDLSRLIQKL